MKKDYRLLRFSKYNLQFQIRNHCFIYNTLFGSLVRINDDLSKRMGKENTNLLTDKEIKLLTYLKILINKDFDELNYIREKNKESQKSNIKTHILLTTTLACNCACPYCFQGHTGRIPTGSAGEFEKIILFIKKTVLNNKSRLLQIDFFGGEPLLRLDVVEKVMKNIVFFGAKNNIETRFRFYTNGTIMNDKVLAIMDRWRNYLKDFQITIDGPKKLHNARRPLRGQKKASSFSLLKKNVGILVDNKFPVKIRINVDKDNSPYLKDFLKELKSYKWSRSVSFYLYSVKNMADTCGNYNNFLDELDFNSIETNLWREMLKLKLNIPLRPKVKFIYCSAFNKNSYVVDYLGDVYKCAVLQQNPNFKIGYIDNKGELVITNKKIFEKWLGRNPLKTKECKKCKFLPTCASGCAGSAYFKYGKFNINNCAGNQTLFIEKLKLYIEKRYFQH